MDALRISRGHFDPQCTDEPLSWQASNPFEPWASTSWFIGSGANMAFPAGEAQFDARPACPGGDIRIGEEQDYDQACELTTMEAIMVRWSNAIWVAAFASIAALFAVPVAATAQGIGHCYVYKKITYLPPRKTPGGLIETCRTFEYVHVFTPLNGHPLPPAGYFGDGAWYSVTLERCRANLDYRARGMSNAECRGGCCTGYADGVEVYRHRM